MTTKLPSNDDKAKIIRERSQTKNSMVQQFVHIHETLISIVL